MTDVVTLTPEHFAAYQRVQKAQERAGNLQGWGETEGGLAITRKYISELSKAISEKLEAAQNTETDRGKSRTGAEALIGSLDPDVVALATLSTSLNGIAKGLPLTGTLVRIGLNIEGEVWSSELKDFDHKLHTRADQWARRDRSRLSSRQQAARNIAERGGFKLAKWTSDNHTQVGAWLVETLLESLPDVFVLEEREGSRDAYYLQITEGALKLACDAFEQAVRLRPVMFPSEWPPLPWQSLTLGGPRDPAGHHSTKVVRTLHQETQGLVRAAISDGQMQPTLDALNTIQRVPWTINKRVLEVILECEKRGIAVKGGVKGWGVPPAKDVTLPEYPEGGSASELKQWGIDCARAKRTNRTLAGERLGFRADLTTAKMLAENERFYVPHNLDWRGRVYGLSHFNFQRDDRVRALFLFDRGEAIGEDGLRWLKIHTANCGDFGKVSKRPFEERVKWSNDNAAVIAAIAENPLADEQLAVWTKADKPFLFLAACLELASACKVGASFVTSLPVSWDGSCSGLQHLCAMTRAPEGSLVNLTDTPEPQDVYSLVAEVAFESIALDVDDEKFGKFARLALAYDGNRRKLVKRNVMTYSYSSKKFGMSQQLITDLMDPLAEQVQRGERDEHPFGENESTQAAAARYLASKIFAAIETVVDRPARAMAFLQKIARALAHEGKVMEWVTPTGLPWSNRYHEPTTKRVRLWMRDRGVSLRIATGYEKPVDKDRAANGVAPNLVHACDAAHLMMVVNAAAAEGITNHALVHDSFGCLASQSTRYHQIIREQFVRLYEEHDVLAEVLERATLALSEHNRDRLPDRVDAGDLNIKEVLNATYAFA